jgi:deoxyribose-phosphate aldolase
MAREAAGTGVQIITVAGFPLGYQQTETKILETQTALDQGADEIDLVWNMSAFKAGMTWPKIEIAKVSTLVHRYEKLLKVIIETGYLNDSEITQACMICQDSGVDFVKTSTGFAPSGAKVADITLMRSVLANRVGIKASGGISDRATAEAMIRAGADRIGTSSGVAIIS